MEPCLYDTSWTLHYIDHVSDSFRNLTAFEERALKRPAKQFKDFLRLSKVTDPDDSDSDKTGGLRECTWRPIMHGNVEERVGILVSILYEKISYKFILYGKEVGAFNLVLTRAPAHLVKRFTIFLFDTYGTSTQPLKLPSTLLYDSLEYYLTTILVVANSDATGSSLSKATLSSLKLTFSFSAPVAPKLKTLDVDVPLASITNPAAPTQNILQAISQTVANTTGIQPITLGFESASKESEHAIARISKISCAAFAVSVDGRLKFSSKAVDAALQFEDTVTAANEKMMEAVIMEAERRVALSNR